VEVSALKYSGGIGLHGRTPLLRLQSDERLVAMIRRGNHAAFESLVGRYETRLLAFCRHLLGSREDAEDVLQEVLAAAFNAILADERPINVRPWLYRIARNRSLNHLRRIQAVGVDSMDVHFSDFGASTADKVYEREEFRLLVGDIHSLPETQKTALVLREMDALSYEQIAEAMETTVPSVKSLLVRARISLAEASEARLLSCDEVRIELGELAEGLRRRPSPLVRRHLRACKHCEGFRLQLRETNKALAALLPAGPLILLKKLVVSHLGHGAGAGSSAGAASSGAGAVGSSAALGSTASISSAGGFMSAGVGAIATKAAAGLAVTALVTAGAVEVSHGGRGHAHAAVSASVVDSEPPAALPVAAAHTVRPDHAPTSVVHDVIHLQKPPVKQPAPVKHVFVAFVPKPVEKAPPKPTAQTGTTKKKTALATPPPPPPRSQTLTVQTVLPPAAVSTTASTTPAVSSPATTSTPAPPTTAPVQPAPPTTDGTDTTTPPPTDAMPTGAAPTGAPPTGTQPTETTPTGTSPAPTTTTPQAPPSTNATTTAPSPAPTATQGP